MINENFFDHINTELQVYWLGMISADGSVSRNRSHLTIKLTNRKRYGTEHRDHLLRLRDVVGGRIGFVTEKYIYDSGDDKGEHALSVYIRIYNKKIVADLIKIGIIPNKTYADISSVLLSIPKRFEKDFIRGFFDGDGCISIQETPVVIMSRNPDFEITCKCKNFLENLSRMLCKRSGIPLLTVRKGHNNTYRIATKRYDYILKIRDFMYKDATIYLARKKDKMYKVGAPGKTPTSKYRGVKFDKTVGKWRADVPDPERKGKRNIWDPFWMTRKLLKLETRLYKNMV